MFARGYAVIVRILNSHFRKNTVESLFTYVKYLCTMRSDKSMPPVCRHTIRPWNRPCKRGNPSYQHTVQGVRKVRVWSLIAATIFGAIAAQGQVHAQAEGNAATQRVAVAVVDIGYILKNHPTIKPEMEAIQANMQAADEEMAKKRDAILKQMDQLRSQYTEGTPEYEKAEKAIAEQDTEFRLKLIKEKKRFEEAQAMVVYKVYNNITSLVQAASAAWGTQVVMRVSREKMDPKKPETVQMVMGQNVIYFNPEVDLTEWVLGQLNNQTAQRTTGVNR